MSVVRIKLTVLFGILAQSSASQVLHSNGQPQTTLATSRFLCSCFTLDYFLTNDTIAQQSYYMATDEEAENRSCMSLVDERLKEKGVILSSPQIKDYCMACNCVHTTRNLFLMKVVAYGIALSLFGLAGLVIVLMIISNSPCAWSKTQDIRRLAMMKYLREFQLHQLFGVDKEKIIISNEYEEL